MQLLNPLTTHQSGIICFYDYVQVNYSHFWLLWFQSQFEQDLIIVMLAIGICVPSVFVFIESLTKSVFGNKEWPTFGTIFIVRMSAACIATAQYCTKFITEASFKHACVIITQ